jgi:hypothetical protein
VVRALCLRQHPPASPPKVTDDMEDISHVRQLFPTMNDDVHQPPQPLLTGEDKASREKSQELARVQDENTAAESETHSPRPNQSIEEEDPSAQPSLAAADDDDDDGGGGKFNSHEDEPVPDEELHREYIHLLDAHKRRITHDKADVRTGLRRERWFTVDYNRMSRNKLWAAKEGPECQYYDGTPEEYKDGQDVWPKGRDLHTIGIYSQAYDFFRFMWNHTKPCKVVFVIMVLAIMKPFQVVSVSYVVQYIERNPKTAPLWVYYINFIGFAIEKWVYWRYEILVPLNCQRVQMRCVLLQQRARLPHDHPIAKKWPSGR